MQLFELNDIMVAYATRKEEIESRKDTGEENKYITFKTYKTAID